ncbi:MAG: four helix bundle protein [Candidatus Omnitrophota bacterium]
MQETKKIRSYRDLNVYQRTYDAALSVMMKIIPKLPDSEKYDLRNQLSRSSKSIPRLIAEGYAKRHQKQGFQKYLDDAMGECNETVVSLSQCRDIYAKFIDKELCDKLIEIYDISGRQLYRLEESWSRFKGKNKQTT